jgi:hypothetical protein
MSYALGAAPSRAKDGIQVGERAGRDVILARASWDASQILLDAVKQRKPDREVYIERRLKRYAPDAGRRFVQNMDRLLARGRNRNQAIYDSMRLIIADYYAQLGIEAIQAATANIYGADYGLGDDAKDIGCGITGGITAIGGAILGAYTGGAGATPVAVGGSLVGQALDCGSEARESQERIAAAQAQGAQAAAEAALAAAEAEERLGRTQAEERTKQVKTIAFVGGGLLLLLVTGYAIVKV